MTPSQLHFLLELLMTREERAFLSALKENPSDLATRNEYVDYLLEQGREESAEMIRMGTDSGWTPMNGAPLTMVPVSQGLHSGMLTTVYEPRPQTYYPPSLMSGAVNRSMESLCPDVIRRQI